MSKPWSKVSRLTWHRQQLRKTPKGSKERLARAYDFFGAMAATANKTRPGSTKDAIERVARALIDEGEALAALAPAERLERGGPRR